jgi:DNA modification methylase
LKNRFNRLTSKEWLPFQKSWFKFETVEKLYLENLRFFTQAETTNQKALYFGPSLNVFKQQAESQIIEVSDNVSASEEYQFILLDLRDEIEHCKSLEDYLRLRQKVIVFLEGAYTYLAHRRFVSVFIPNKTINTQYFPFAWDIAWQLATIYSLKDEKIACRSVGKDSHIPEDELFYCMYFRKDENSNGQYQLKNHSLFNILDSSPLPKLWEIPGWFVLKPAPRKKNEILHPAKYPEELVHMFLNQFTEEGQNILDPMSGTGSTQVASLKHGRNAFGTELSPFFADIAQQRCKEITNPSQPDLFSARNEHTFKILNKDARLINSDDFPEIHYMITSPPYWDMLNMKGAENQAKRVEKGLQTNYSDDHEDLGNISDYELFLTDLTEIYFNIFEIMPPGSVMTVVVKNIKKKGKNYPFAWDLADRLCQKMILLPEVFWCQDDINLAPYGYGNTFVSNTFHQYCLSFMKP